MDATMGTTIVGKMSSSNNANRKSRNTKTNNNSKLLVLVNSVAVVTALFSTYYFMFEPVTLKPYPQEENPFDKLGLARTNNNTAANATAIPEEALGVLPFDDYYDDDSDADDQAFVDSYEYDEEDDDGFLSGGNETRTLASFWGSFRFSGRRNHATTTSSLRKTTAKAPP